MRWPFRRTAVPVYWHEAYRPPLSGIEASGIHARRSDFAFWYLLEARITRNQDVRRPLCASFSDLALVHGREYLASLLKAETLARIFAVQPSDVPVEELLKSIRLACGGTIAAAQEALTTTGPVMNLLGGFHHAAPDHGGGFCAVNDIAVAVAVLRSQGFSDRVVILDLDAHPPDGTSACFTNDKQVWIGSLSGSNWGALPIAFQRVLTERCGDDEYLHHLEALLSAMPRAHLTFVLAGGDVLNGDPLGRLGLTLQGARKRDGLVALRLEGRPSVWLPGGGYQRDSWKLLAGTVMALTKRSHQRIPDSFDPLAAHYRHVADHLRPEALGQSTELTLEDIESDLHVRSPRPPTLLGTYTAQGMEYALFEYGILWHLERLGYRNFKAQVDTSETGDRLRLFGDSQGTHHLLMELVLSRRTLQGTDYLFIEWLTLRNPRATFGAARPKLPGQDVPGLGLARETAEFLVRVAENLGLQGVAFRPAWFHLAVVASDRFRFLNPEHQKRFEALQQKLSAIPLQAATQAVADGKVQMDGVPYRWKAEDMVFALHSTARTLDRAASAQGDGQR